MKPVENDSNEKLSNDELIKLVFDNLRNIIICATLATVAGALYRFRADMLFGVEWNSFIAFFLAISSMGLLTWNIIHGVSKIVRPYRKKRWMTLLLLVPMSAVYMSTAWAVLSVWPLLTADTTSIQTTQPQSQSIQRDEPLSGHVTR